MIDIFIYIFASVMQQSGQFDAKIPIAMDLSLEFPGGLQNSKDRS